METILEIFAIILLMGFKGFFSGSEIAIVNSDKLKLRHLAKQGAKGAALVLKRFKTPDIILGTTLVGTNVATVAVSTMGALLFIDIFGDGGDIIAALFFSPFMLILGEIVPKSIYQQKADTISPIIIYPLTVATYLFYPVIFVFSRIARFVTKLVGGKSSTRTGYISREEIRMLLEIPDSTPDEDEDRRFDKERVRSIIRYAETTVGAVMLPLADVTGIEDSANIQEAIDLVMAKDFNRLPVYSNNITDIVGTLTLKTWHLLDPGLAQKQLKDLMQEPLFISPVQTVHEVLHQLLGREDRMGVVVDEYGSAIGILLVEDLFQEVIGEATDIRRIEGGPAEAHHRELIVADGEDEYLVDGRTPVSQLNEKFNMTLPLDEGFTLAGLLVNRLRSIPKVGASLALHDYLFTVEEADGRTVNKVRMERI